ncbi:MAG: hypothetical protein WEA11_08010 [Acidimicrobiales bacterium]
MLVFSLDELLVESVLVDEGEDEDESEEPEATSDELALEEPRASFL